MSAELLLDKARGKIERFNGCLKASFSVAPAASLKASSTALTVELAHRQVRRWLGAVANERVHGTTGPVQRCACPKSVR